MILNLALLAWHAEKGVMAKSPLVIFWLWLLERSITLRRPHLIKSVMNFLQENPKTNLSSRWLQSSFILLLLPAVENEQKQNVLDSVKQ